MMDGFLTTLEAHDPSPSLMRSYRREVSTDSLGHSWSTRFTVVSA